MDFMVLIERAITLYSQASDLMEKVKPSLENIKADESATLEEARERLAKALSRADAAHDALKEALDNEDERN